jgi:hypothetical protein
MDIVAIIVASAILFFLFLGRSKNFLASYLGWIGETKTKFHLWLGLSAKDYWCTHDVIIPSSEGSAQIDHLIVSKFGLFIIETKNRRGWIFGSGDQPRWTQSLYGNNYSFQNPLRQTYRQKKVLASILDIDEKVIQDIVYFVGKGRFKTLMPGNVIRRGLARHIKKQTKVIFSDGEVNAIIHRIQGIISKSNLSKKDHLRSLAERKNASANCPRCGGDMRVRMAKRGPNSGSKFLGCTNYPNCRYTVDLP